MVINWNLVFAKFINLRVCFLLGWLAHYLGGLILMHLVQFCIGKKLDLQREGERVV